MTYTITHNTETLRYDATCTMIHVDRRQVDLNNLESFNGQNIFTYSMGLKLETSTYIAGSEASGMCFNVSDAGTVATEVVTESSVRFQIYGTDD